jgi:plasmid stability protein
MKSISVHGIDGETEKALKERAKKRGLSVNKAVKELLAESLGLGDRPKDKDNRAAFADLCGIWTPEEAEEFQAASSDLKSVDSKDWR